MAGTRTATVDACLFLGSEAVRPLSVVQKKNLRNATGIYPLHPDWMGSDSAQRHTHCDPSCSSNNVNLTSTRFVPRVAVGQVVPARRAPEFCGTDDTRQAKIVVLLVKCPVGTHRIDTREPLQH